MVVKETNVNDRCTVRIHDDAYRNRSPAEISQTIKAASAVVIVAARNAAREKTA